MKSKILVTILLLAIVVPFFSGSSQLEAGRAGRATTGALIAGGIVGAIVGNMVANRPCHHCCHTHVVERPVYVEPVYVYEQPVVYVPQRRVVQEVRYEQVPVYQRTVRVYR